MLISCDKESESAEHPQRPAPTTRLALGPRRGVGGAAVSTPVMHLLRTLLALLFVAGHALSLPVKGGEKGGIVKGGQWSQPKDWDWSVTTSSTERSSTGRLIPVSEATDDLPTPGYKMSDLQQKVRIVPVVTVNGAFLPKEDLEDNSQTRETISSSENKNKEESNSNIKDENNSNTNIPIEENKESVLQSLDLQHNFSVVKETLPLQTTPSSETSKSIPEPQSTENDFDNSHKHADTEKTERVPVNEPPMVKVTLPEICSITGIGCRDKPSLPNEEPHTSVIDLIEKSTESLPSQENKSTDLLLHTTDSKFYTSQDISETTKRSTDDISKEEHVTQNQDNSYSSNSDQQTSMNPKSNPITSSVPSDFQSTEKSNFFTSEPSSIENKEEFNTESKMEKNEDKVSQAQQTLDSQVMQSDLNLQQDQAEEAIIEKVDSFDNLEHPVHEDQTPLDDQIHLGSSLIEDQKPQNPIFKVVHNKKDSDEEGENSNEESDLHDNQKTLYHEVRKEIKESEENEKSSEEHDQYSQVKLHPNEFSAQRRLDENPEIFMVNNSNPVSIENNEKHLNGSEIEKNSQDTVYTEEEKKLIEAQQFEKQNLTTEQPKEQTESPSLGERITSYWKAATGFVSKALNI